MTPRLNIPFSLSNQWTFCFGKVYSPLPNEYLLNHARTGIVMALRATLPTGGRVGVVAYNCHTVANAVVQSRCTPIFIDVTDDLLIDLQHLSKLQLDALVLTNLFGIQNDILAIRQVIGTAILIVDNAHGYGIPVEGDFTVYSINQGKFPALGEGGILYVNNPDYTELIQAQYTKLNAYSFAQETKLFVTMLLKAIMHTSWIYKVLTLHMKQKRKSVVCRSEVVLKRMAKGVSRIYKLALPTIPHEITQQRYNAKTIAEYLIQKQYAHRAWYGNNAFMLIAQTEKPEFLKNYLMQHGVESATHFAHAIDWAIEFGYKPGDCPKAEQLTKKLLMIPTYKQISL